MSYHDLTPDFSQQLQRYRELLQRIETEHPDAIATTGQKVSPKVWRPFAETLMSAETEQRVALHVAQNLEAAKFCLKRVANTTDVSIPDISLDDYEKVRNRPFYLVGSTA